MTFLCLVLVPGSTGGPRVKVNSLRASPLPTQCSRANGETGPGPTHSHITLVLSDIFPQYMKFLSLYPHTAFKRGELCKHSLEGDQDVLLQNMPFGHKITLSRRQLRPNRCRKSSPPSPRPEARHRFPVVTVSALHHPEQKQLLSLGMDSKHRGLHKQT